MKLRMDRSINVGRSFIAFLVGLLIATSGLGSSNAQSGSEQSGRPHSLSFGSMKMNDSSIDKKKSRPQRSVTLGTWGGQHIRMIVTANGATIEYDCAQGSIASKLTLDAERKFSLNGSHMMEGPGPIRIGITRQGRPARFDGQVNGDEMSFSVVLTDSNESIGDFILRRGSEGRLRKCR
jgi:hypothetical protein